MTRIDQPLTREAVEGTPRKRLTKAQRQILLTRQHWRCAGCEMLLIGELAIDEHILPIWLGGSNDLSNRELRCIPCAKSKTKDDLDRINKTKRLQRDHDPETRRRTKNPLRSRGFQRADPLKETQ